MIPDYFPARQHRALAGARAMSAPHVGPCVLPLLFLATVIGLVTATSFSPAATELELECCEAIHVSDVFFYNSHLGARTYGLRGSQYEWDINSATGRFYFNESLSRWVYGMPNEELPDGRAFVTHTAVATASCPNETDWVRLMDPSAQPTNEVFELPVTCVSSHRRIFAFDQEARRFYGDQDDSDGKALTGATLIDALADDADEWVHGEL